MYATFGFRDMATLYRAIDHKITSKSDTANQVVSESIFDTLIKRKGYEPAVPYSLTRNVRLSAMSVALVFH